MLSALIGTIVGSCSDGESQYEVERGEKRGEKRERGTHSKDDNDHRSPSNGDEADCT
jgi:hypothetical protein